MRLLCAVAAVLALLAFSQPASAGCTDTGRQVTSACQSFIQQVKSASGSLPCGDVSNPAPGTVAALVASAAPDPSCCSAASAFFGAGCACDGQIQGLAQQLYAISPDQLKGAAKAAQLKCNTGPVCGGC